MTVQTTTVTGVAASAALTPDINAPGARTTLFVRVGAGSTVTVQVTADDPSSGSATWLATGIAALTAITADAVVELYPARGVRLNQTVAGAQSQLQTVSTGGV